jgi:hypothetical protein
MADNSSAHSAQLQFYLCIQKDCARRVVALKISTHDSAPTELTGLDLQQRLQTLIEKKRMEALVDVRETSWMRGCRVGPRLNVVVGGHVQEAVCYVHLPANRRHWRCLTWADVDSVESLLEQ